MVKKSDSSFNVVFKDNSYTNKLYARNIELTHNPAGSTLAIDYSHYSKQKRNNLEDSDFERLVNQQAQISHFAVLDKTVQQAIAEANVVQVTVKLSDTVVVTVPVTAYDKASGLLR